MSEASESQSIGTIDPDYIRLIRDLMAAHDTPHRSLAEKTGISKSRLGRILHQSSQKRLSMTVDELEAILQALGTNILKAFMRTEALRDLDPSDQARYDSVINLVGDIVKDLGKELVRTLETMNGLDGTEARPEWAAILRNGWIEDIAKAVAFVMGRRTVITQRDELWR
ncbi:helix-turn-helix transcriptional regulator [Sphingobium sp. H39-3-25]|uniref:helix-turn-helix domain-containing protein n=1 Tax=Sphingobium arseniciresistens TaxID=3030834 RepID=UPI0023B9C16C|nr:helix-turn-helix transcriptional regulator [Sphingobium arseniciresistens]